MAWVKIPPANHPILLAALPKDSRVRTVRMFGAVCGLAKSAKPATKKTAKQPRAKRKVAVRKRAK